MEMPLAKSHPASCRSKRTISRAFSPMACAESAWSGNASARALLRVTRSTLVALSPPKNFWSRYTEASFRVVSSSSGRLLPNASRAVMTPAVLVVSSSASVFCVLSRSMYPSMMTFPTSCGGVCGSRAITRVHSSFFHPSPGSSSSDPRSSPVWGDTAFATSMVAIRQGSNPIRSGENPLDARDAEKSASARPSSSWFWSEPNPSHPPPWSEKMR